MFGLQSEKFNFSSTTVLQDQKGSNFVFLSWNNAQGGYDYFLLLLGKSSIWFTEKHILKFLKYIS